MRNLIGLEMVCFQRSRHFELTYEAGVYRDDKHAPVEDILDLNCYVCTASFFTTAADGIAYCPNCGHVDRKRFEELSDLMDFMGGQDLSWLKRNGLKAVGVHTEIDGWQRRFTASPDELAASQKYQQVRTLS